MCSTFCAELTNNIPDSDDQDLAPLDFLCQTGEEGGEKFLGAAYF